MTVIPFNPMNETLNSISTFIFDALVWGYITSNSLDVIMRRRLR